MKYVFCFELEVYKDNDISIEIPDKDYQSRYFDNDYYEYTVYDPENTDYFKIRRIFDFSEQGIKDTLVYINRIKDSLYSSSSNGYYMREYGARFTELCNFVLSFENKVQSYIDKMNSGKGCNKDYTNYYDYSWCVKDLSYSITWDLGNPEMGGVLCVMPCNVKEIERIIYKED